MNYGILFVMLIMLLALIFYIWFLITMLIHKKLLKNLSDRLIKIQQDLDQLEDSTNVIYQIISDLTH